MYKYFELPSNLRGYALSRVRQIIGRELFGSSNGVLILLSEAETLCTLLGIRFDEDGEIILDYESEVK